MASCFNHQAVCRVNVPFSPGRYTLCVGKNQEWRRERKEKKIKDRKTKKYNDNNDQKKKKIAENNRHKNRQKKRQEENRKRTEKKGKKRKGKKRKENKEPSENVLQVRMTSKRAPHPLGNKSFLSSEDNLSLRLLAFLS